MFAELCISTVTRFKSYLVYYLLKPDRIEVIRVLHGGRGNIDELLSDSLHPN
jgi:plasmid stabilization system protein ParE